MSYLLLPIAISYSSFVINVGLEVNSLVNIKSDFL